MLPMTSKLKVICTNYTKQHKKRKTPKLRHFRKIGAIILLYFKSNQSFIASNTEAINNITEPAKIPVIAAEEGICKGCGVATLSISYYDIGYRAGEMAYKILENGEKPEKMPIEYSTDLTKKYVAKRAEALKLKIPDDYEEIVME